MNALPLISVIIPLYNRKDLVGKTLDSLISQTYLRWEAVVVDDGSDDGSFTLVQEYAKKEERIRLIKRNRESKGAPTCRNIGAELAQGEYLIFLDSDDELASFCLQQRVETIHKNPGLDFWVFPMLLFHHEKNDMNILWNIDTGEDDLIRFLRLDAVWQTSSPIYKKSYFISTGGFKEDLPFWQDFELHTRLLIANPTYKKFLDLKPDVYLRRHESESISQVPLYSEKQLEKKLEVSESILDRLVKQQKSDQYLQTFKLTIFSILEDLISKFPHNPLNFAAYWHKLYQLRLSSVAEYSFFKWYFKVLRTFGKFPPFYPVKKIYRKLIPMKYKVRKTTLCRVPLDQTNNYGK